MRPGSSTSAVIKSAAMKSGGTWWVFGTLCLFYALCTSGHVLSPDAVMRARATEGLLLRGRPSVDARGVPQGFLAVGRDGESYPKYEAGPSLAAVPFFALGAAAAELAPRDSERVFRGPIFLWYSPDDPRDAWRMAGVALTNAVLVAALCALLFALLREIGYSPRVALAATAAAAVASPLWVYAKDFFAEPLAALGLLMFALFLERAAASASWRAALASGAGLGISILARFAHLALLPLALLVVAHALAEPRLGRRRAWRLGISMALGLALFLAVGAWWNWLRFGAVLASGYGDELQLWTTPPLLGLRGLLLSPGRGLLPHFPLLLLALAMTPGAWRRSARWTAFAWGTLAVLLAVYCRWHGWDGGWCWGPRFLVPAVPLLALVVAPFFAASGLGPWRRVAGYVLLALSAVVSFAGTVVSYTDFDQALRHAGGPLPYLEVVRWSWRAFPPIAYWSFEPKAFYLVAQALATPAAWWLAALFGAGFGLLPFIARHTVRVALAERAELTEDAAPPLSLGPRAWALVAAAAALFAAVARWSG